MRRSQYPYTRPACALVGVGTVYTLDGLIDSSDHHAAPAGTSPPGATTSLERMAALPLLAVGVGGTMAVLGRRGGLGWLSYGYEQFAWGVVYGSLAASATATLAASDHHSGGGGGGGGSGISKWPHRDADAEATRGVSEIAHALLTPAAGAALAATAGERLGSAVGLPLVLTLTGAGCIAAAVATNVAPPTLLQATHQVAETWGSLGIGSAPSGAPTTIEATAHRACLTIQASSLLLMPALHLATLPVYTHSTMQAALGVLWLWLAAGTPTLLDGVDEVASEPTRQLFLAVGAPLRFADPHCTQAHLSVLNACVAEPPAGRERFTHAGNVERAIPVYVARVGRYRASVCAHSLAALWLLDVNRGRTPRRCTAHWFSGTRPPLASLSLR